MHRRAFLAAAAATALGAGGCSKKPSAPAGPRIAALSPALAATLKDLGLESKVVGRHAWDLVLDSSTPVVGDGLGEVDYEKLTAAGPTLVVGEFGASGTPARLMDLAASKGWRVLAYNPLSLRDVSATMTSLAEAAEAQGCAGATARARELDQDLKAALASNAVRAAAGRVLLVAEASPLSVLGPGSVHHDILVALGGLPAITQGKPFMTLDAEDVRAMDPDAIIIIAPRGRDEPSSPKTAEELAGWLGRVGTLEIQAVRSRRLAKIDDPLTHLPATTIRRTARAMAGILDYWVVEFR